MEISAVFAVTLFRKMKSTALVVISDELKSDKWSKFQPELFIKSLNLSLNSLLEFFSP